MEQLRELTLEQMIGQKLVTGFPSKIMSREFINAVKKYKIGNVILFRENVESEEQLIRLCTEIRELILSETGFPAFITVDQEGGMVCRLPESAANMPGAMAVAAAGEEKNAYMAGLYTAQEMRCLGLNFDLAPVVDINSNPRNPVIGVRSYGDTPEQVIDYSLQMLRGLADGGVLAAVKHFPGHGDTEVDSHLDLPRVNKSYEELCTAELMPFTAAIKAGVPAVMAAHILFPELDGSGRPATMSRPILTGILRKKLGFQGLILSDCMEMKAIASYYGTLSGTVEAIKAGVDLVFISHDAVLAGETCEAVAQAVRAGEISMTEIEESVRRITEQKRKLPVPAGIPDRQEAKRFADSLRQKSLCIVQSPPLPFVLGDNPISIGCPAVRVTLAGNAEDQTKSFAASMTKEVGGEAFVCSADPSCQEIEAVLSAAKGHTSAVIGSYNAHLRKGQKELIEAVAALGLPTAVLALRDPYDLEHMNQSIFGIAVFEYTEQAIAAAAKVLRGEIQAEGKMPVRLS